MIVNLLMSVVNCLSFFFFFTDSTSTLLYTLSLHDALPILFGVITLRLGLKRKIERHRKLGPIVSVMWFITADRKSTRLNSSHVAISYAVFCLKKKKDGTFTREDYVEIGSRKREI